MKEQVTPLPIDCPRCASHRVYQLSRTQWRCNACGKRWRRKSALALAKGKA